MLAYYSPPNSVLDSPILTTTQPFPLKTLRLNDANLLKDHEVQLLRCHTLFHCIRFHVCSVLVISLLPILVLLSDHTMHYGAYMAVLYLIVGRIQFHTSIPTGCRYQPSSLRSRTGYNGEYKYTESQ